MAFDDLQPLSRQYISDLAGNVVNGTHTAQIVRYSGSLEDARSRIVQASAGTAPEHTIYLEGFASGDAFQRLVVKGLLSGSWTSAEVWEGSVQDAALEAFRAG
jgi:hypothetical protein